MAELPQRSSAMMPTQVTEDAHPAAALCALPPMSRFIFRGDPGAALLAGTAFGAELANVPCRATTAGPRVALWLGPDEWMLLAPEDAAPEIETSMPHALGELPFSLVAVSHRNMAFEVRGPRAADVLNGGCPLDLDKSAFPVNMCTRTVLGKAEIILWRAAEEIFHVGVWRSFAPYVRDFLVEARARL